MSEMPEDGDEDEKTECTECGDVCAKDPGLCPRCLEAGQDNYEQSVSDSWLQAVRGY